MDTLVDLQSFKAFDGDVFHVKADETIEHDGIGDDICNEYYRFNTIRHGNCPHCGITGYGM